MLNSVDEVIAALDGTVKASVLIGVHKSAVSQWRKRGIIPADRFLIITSLLQVRGLQANVAIFGMKQPATTVSA